METVFIPPENLAGKYGSKKSLYDVITIDCEWTNLLLPLVRRYLPPYSKCPVSFIKDVISKKKEVSNNFKNLVGTVLSKKIGTISKKFNIMSKKI